MIRIKGWTIGRPNQRHKARKSHKGKHNRKQRSFSPGGTGLAGANIMIKPTRRTAPTLLLLLAAALSGCARAKSCLTVETLALPSAPHAILLHWQPSPEAKSYNVHRSARPDGPYRKIGASSTTWFLDFPVSAPATLYYWVTAVNDNGEGAPSSRLTVSLR